jgi:hypothetical protein
MNPLEPPDSIHLQAAQGWLDLGNPIEANEELEKIAPQNRAQGRTAPRLHQPLPGVRQAGSRWARVAA